MQTEVSLVRAIGSEFLRRKFKSVLITLAVICGVLLLIEFWLTTLSAWWWLLVIPTLLLLFAGVIICFVVARILSLVRPTISKGQTKAVSLFVDKLERVSETLGMPVFMVFFQIMRDVIRPRDQTFIQGVTKDGTTLHTDYITLHKEFKRG